MTADGESGLRHGAIGSAHIVFFVVAAAAPLTATLGVSPAAFAFGNGAAVPAVYLLAGALYLLFSAGFTAMSPYVASSSGFYAYVLKGLGPTTGGGVAAVALLSYQAIAVSSYALFGFFTAQTLFSAGGMIVPWWALALPLTLLVHLCGQRSITFSGGLLAICMLGEITILLILGFSILAADGPGTFPPATMGMVFGEGLGPAIVFVVASFIGFEATVIFGEEARDPARTIPRATYIAVLLIALFYGFCTWTITIYYGAGAIKAAALAHPGDLYLAAIRHLLGTPAVAVTDALLLTSVFACVLSFHVTIARYLCAMAREGLCDARLSAIHPRHRSPHVAGAAQTLISAALIILCAAMHLDPYTEVFAWTGTLASLGILVIQIITALAVFNFFRRSPARASWFKGIAAPLGSAGGLAACLFLAVSNIDLVAGSRSPWLSSLPVAIVVAMLAGGYKARITSRTNR